MNLQTSARQHLIEAINTFPAEAIEELASFVNYLCYKSTQQPETKGNTFLMAIARLGASSESKLKGDKENETTHQNYL